MSKNSCNKKEDKMNRIKILQLKKEVIMYPKIVAMKKYIINKIQRKKQNK